MKLRAVVLLITLASLTFALDYVNISLTLAIQNLVPIQPIQLKDTYASIKALTLMGVQLPSNLTSQLLKVTTDVLDQGLYVQASYGAAALAMAGMKCTNPALASILNEILQKGNPLAKLVALETMNIANCTTFDSKLKRIV